MNYYCRKSENSLTKTTRLEYFSASEPYTVADLQRFFLAAQC